MEAVKFVCCEFSVIFFLVALQDDDLCARSVWVCRVHSFIFFVNFHFCGCFFHWSFLDQSGSFFLCSLFSFLFSFFSTHSDGVHGMDAVLSDERLGQKGEMGDSGGLGPSTLFIKNFLSQQQ